MVGTAQNTERLEEKKGGVSSRGEFIQTQTADSRVPDTVIEDQEHDSAIAEVNKDLVEAMKVDVSGLL